MISSPSLWSTLLTLAWVWAQTGVVSGATTDPDLEAQKLRGQQVYADRCAACHRNDGTGVAGSIPPIAASDFLMLDKTRSIAVVVDGLAGQIEVNGKGYNSIMPRIIINDQQIADVLTYVRNTWGNQGEAVTPEEVLTYRRTTPIKSYDALVALSPYPALPKPPVGFTLREVAKMPFNPVRIASDGTGKTLYVLTSPDGGVWRVQTDTGKVDQLLKASDYLERRPDDIGDPVILVGMILDSDRRLYIAANQQNKATRPFQNIVTIYRSTAFSGRDPIQLKPWFQTNYPGNSEYLHGAEGLAVGPDQWLYIANGARTDANQGTGSLDWYDGGETELTSSIWRLDTRKETPQLEIFARGIRNGFGLAFNERGELFESENGPNAHAPEELNLIQKGKHYGFPYQFSDWTEKAYPDSPDIPAGLQIEYPIANLGPDAGFENKPLYTFDPHSSPAGMTFVYDGFPADWRGSLLMVRFGNFLLQPKVNAGFDLLQLKLQTNSAGRYEATVKTLLYPLGRPLDVHKSGKGRLYLAEHARATNSTASFTLPGRILELAVAQSNIVTGGVLSENTTWSGKVSVQSKITVNAPHILTILPGTQITLTNGADIAAINGGIIRVQGSASEPVVFRRLNSSITKWGDLVAQGTGSEVHVSHASVTYGRLRAVSGGSVTVEDSELSQMSSTGIIGGNAGKSFTIRRTYVHDYEDIDLINTVTLAEDSLFERANSDIFELQSSPPGSILRRCTFRNCLNPNSDAVDMNGCQNVLIDSCLIYSVTDKGISSGSASSASDPTSKGLVVTNTLVYLADMALALKDNATASVFQSTFADTRVGLAGYGKFTQEGGHLTAGHNNLFWNNTTSIDLKNNSSAALEFSDTQGSVHPGTGNISTDPQWLNPIQNDYRLSTASPALQAGRDGTPLGVVLPVGAPMARSHPVIESTSVVDGGALELGFWADATRTIAVQFRTALGSGTWNTVKLIPASVSGSEYLTTRLSRGSDSTGFYRLVLDP